MSPSGGAQAPGASARSARDLVGAGLGVLMGLLFSFVVILGKGLLHGEPPFALLFFRFGVAASVLAVLTVLTGRPLVPERGERLGLALAATLGYGTESALYFAGLNHGSAAAVTLLFYTYPVWVMLTAMTLDRRVPARMLVTALGRIDAPKVKTASKAPRVARRMARRIRRVHSSATAWYNAQ